MLQFPLKHARDSFLNDSLPTTLTYGSTCCGCLQSTFEETSAPPTFYSSHLLSRGWLLTYRLTVFSYLLLIAVFDWTGTGFGDGVGWDAIWNSSPSRHADDYTKSNIPPVYLTYWGFLATLCYFTAALVQSIKGYKKRPENGRKPPHEPQKYHFAPLSIISAGNFQVPSFGDHLTAYLFALSCAIQPFIVVGFWGLVFPFSLECDYKCATVHGGAFVFTYIDLLLNKITISKKLMPLVIAFPTIWLLTQIWWIYTDHQPDYEVLPMDNWLSLGLSIGCLFLFYCNYRAAVFACGKRDQAWGFPGGVSGREGPPASAYFNGGVEGSIRF